MSIWRSNSLASNSWGFNHKTTTTNKQINQAPNHTPILLNTQRTQGAGRHPCLQNQAKAPKETTRLFILWKMTKRDDHTTEPTKTYRNYQPEVLCSLKGINGTITVTRKQHPHSKYFLFLITSAISETFPQFCIRASLCIYKLAHRHVTDQTPDCLFFFPNQRKLNAFYKFKTDDRWKLFSYWDKEMYNLPFTSQSKLGIYPWNSLVYQYEWAFLRIFILQYDNKTYLISNAILCLKFAVLKS